MGIGKYLIRSTKSLLLTVNQFSIRESFIRGHLAITTYGQRKQLKGEANWRKRNENDNTLRRNHECSKFVIEPR